MANTKCYVLTFWSLDNNELDIAIKDAVNTPTPVDWTEVTQPETSENGACAIGYGYYRNANEYPTLTSATSPTLAPASCRHFLIGYRTEGGDLQNYVTNYDEAIGSQGVSDLRDWLAVWYPTIRNDSHVTELTSASTHMEAARAVALAVNPTCPPFPV